MRATGRLPAHLFAAWRRLLSVSILLKILGIGVLVALLFGGIILLQVHGSLSRFLYRMLESRAHALAASLATRLERPRVTGDLIEVREALDREMSRSRDLRYALVRDSSNEVVAHTFAHGVPPDVARLRETPDLRSGVTPGPPAVLVLDTAEGRIFDTARPILNGYVGTVEVGLSDLAVTGFLEEVTRGVLGALALAAAIGMGLAGLLAHILTRPMRQLANSAREIGKGNFDVRARAVFDDEIGGLAQAFNRMAERLEESRREVREKERLRAALIERLLQVQEDERKAISRELHDEIGQSLLALLMTLQGDCPCRGCCDSSGALCTGMVDRIRGMIEEVRRLSWGMRPTILDDYGLDSALSRHVEETAQRSGLAVDYQYSAPPGVGRLPGAIELTLFRVAQESLANVLRHARATRASVVLLRSPADITLLVEDDGAGFDPAAAAAGGVRPGGRPGLGLLGMRERTALVGGDCAIESITGRGTTVRARIPLAPEAVPCPSAS
ncbi:MAG: HAMP domain-containing protein [Planctomycetes bacterium]|nr:HAMP domain-containing protein [Planctomycetota bacterium]